jgi:predicted ester cyclase
MQPGDEQPVIDAQGTGERPIQPAVPIRPEPAYIIDRTRHPPIIRNLLDNIQESMFPIARTAPVPRRGGADMLKWDDFPLIEANEALGRHFFEEQDRLRGGPSEALCAPGYVACLGGQPAMDRAGHEQFARAFYAAFDGLRHDVEEVFATEDRVAVRFVLHGEHTGSFFGIPPTGRPIEVRANVILHVSNGIVTKCLGVFDEAGMFRQIGV